ncbi:hypothetical protein ACP70R_001838 [Stipagrostis hirtigluma subsp. patula]
MTERREEGGMPADAAATGGEDRLSALPEELLQLVLSSLPSDDAVRASVLARRWRHLWQSTRAVRVAQRAARPWTARTLRGFVDHLLLLRGGAPADEFEISCGELYGDDYYDDEVSDRARARRAWDLGCAVSLWIRHAMSFCQARVIKVSVRNVHRLRLKDVSFVSQSQHLMRLEIADATINSPSLDFSRCPALEDLKMRSCHVYVDTVSSQSLSRLSITDCNFHEQIRTRISTPCIVSLQLSVSSGRAPFIENMPLLKAADVRIQDWCADMCRRKLGGYYSNRDCDLDGCYDCHGINDGSRSVLFEGLSGATDLELTCDPRAFIFRMDCTFCTKFGNLKTLLLNDWCMATDFGALVYFLRYSPILEKLTIQLEYCEKELALVVTDENYNPIENFLVSEQLKVVEIKCCKQNDLLAKILMILKTHGVPPEQISIQQNFCPPDTSGYDTPDSDGYW